MKLQFSPALQTDLAGRDIIVFDGECVLCSGFFRFMLRHDTARQFSFIMAQSDLGARLYRDLGLPVNDFETNLVVIDGQVYRNLDAFSQAMRTLGGGWVPLSWGRYLPKLIKDWLYARIARNRYRFFGRYDTCILPEESVKSRFIAGGWADPAVARGPCA